MAKILAIGNLVLDTLLLTSHFPAEDGELRAQARIRQPGGNAANSLYVLKQLGHEVSLMSVLAADQEAKLLQQTLEQRGVDLTLCERKLKGATPSSYIVVNQQNGTRTIVHYRDLPEVSFEHFAKTQIENFDWLHFEGRNVKNLAGMLNISKTFCPDTPISIDLEKAREGIEPLLNQATVIFTGKHYAHQMGLNHPEACISHIRAHTPHSFIICTWGDQGIWFQSSNGTIEHVPAIPVRVKDTLGAGDTFLAGALHQLVKGSDLKEAVEFGNALAARKCRQFGLDNLMEPLADDRPLAHIDQLSSAKATIAQVPGRNESVILIRDGKAVKAYVNNCPHQHVPLNEAYKVDVNPFEKTLKCSVHDAWFKVENGTCVEGPCIGEHLTPFPIRIDENGQIFADTENNK